MRTYSICSLALVLLVAGSARADDVVLTVEVAGGTNDLTNVIASIPMGGVDGIKNRILHAKDRETKTLLVSQFVPDGRLGQGKREPELLVLLPNLRAGETRIIEVTAVPLPPGLPPVPRFNWEQTANETIELRSTDPARPIAQFTRFEFDSNAVPKAQILTNPTIKPYHHVFDSTGKIRLTNSNEGRFPHHRGIFYGFNQISYQGKKADIWHCRNGEHTQAGRDQHLIPGNLGGIHQFNVAWHGQDGGLFAREQRELAFFPMSKGLLVEFRSLMRTAIATGVKLDGDPQHAGFHFRAHADVEATAKQTYFLRPDGPGKPGEERNWIPKTREGPVNLPWNAMCFELGGKKITVLYLDHPANPKEARQSERTYGRIGTYFVYELTPEKPLFVTYRLWIQDGEMSVEQCNELLQSFLATPKVTRK